MPLEQSHNHITSSDVYRLVFSKSKAPASQDNDPALPRSLSLVPLPVKPQNLGIAQRCAAAPVIEGMPIAGPALLAWNERRFEAVVSFNYCVQMDMGRDAWSVSVEGQ